MSSPTPTSNLPPLSPGELAAESLTLPVTRGLVMAQVQRAHACVPAIVRGGDSEPLHDYRVALRRARSLIGLLGTCIADKDRAWLAAELEALVGSTGAVRDLDVHLVARAEHIAELPDSLRQAGERVFDVLAEEQRRAHAELTEALRGDDLGGRFARLVERLQGRGLSSGRLAGRPFGKEARKVVRQRFEIVRERGAKLDLATDERDVHRYRIACKKLRYALELFAPVLEPRRGLRELRRRLKRTQDGLGAFNDACVQRERLLAHAWPVDEPELRLAAGAMAGIRHVRLSAARASIVEAGARLGTPKLVRAVERELGG